MKGSIGQASVRASLVSLRDARARYNAGVNTKLEVLEAETQLARDRNLLTDRLASQDFARRSLARELDLPQDITPTAATPSTPSGYGSHPFRTASLRLTTTAKSWTS